MEIDQNQETMIKQRLTRRQVIKAGGVAAVGLAFTKPIIETIYPKPAFAQYAPPGGEGCTPGYWKNHTENWVGYAIGTAITSVFTIPAAYTHIGSDDTLLEVLSYPEDGGVQPELAAQNLLRHAVAALLNAAHPEVNYPRTEADIISDVNTALASLDTDTMNALKGNASTPGTLDGDNNLACDIDDGK